MRNNLYYAEKIREICREYEAPSHGRPIEECREVIITRSEYEALVAVAEMLDKNRINTV